MLKERLAKKFERVFIVPVKTNVAVLPRSRRILWVKAQAEQVAPAGA
jgi:hypothetical protein